MDKEGSQEFFVPAGIEADEETRKEKGAQSNGNFCCCNVEYRISKSNPFGDKGESAGKEDEDEAGGEKSS